MPRALRKYWGGAFSYERGIPVSAVGPASGLTGPPRDSGDTRVLTSILVDVMTPAILHGVVSPEGLAAAAVLTGPPRDWQARLGARGLGQRGLAAAAARVGVLALGSARVAHPDDVLQRGGGG